MSEVAAFTARGDHRYEIRLACLSCCSAWLPVTDPAEQRANGPGAEQDGAQIDQVAGPSQVCLRFLAGKWGFRLGYGI